MPDETRGNVLVVKKDLLENLDFPCCHENIDESPQSYFLLILSVYDSFATEKAKNNEQQD